jgi:NAD(P)H-flavin reductase
MILDEDLTDFEKAGMLSYTPVVQNPDENWTMAQGRITPTMVENFLPKPLPEGMVDDSLIMACGPPKLKESVGEILNGLEYRNGFMFN